MAAEEDRGVVRTVFDWLVDHPMVATVAVVAAVLTAGWLLVSAPLPLGSAGTHTCTSACRCSDMTPVPDRSVRAN